MIFFIRFSFRRFQSTATDLGSQMKYLNDNRQFQKAIILYQDQIRKENNQINSFVVTQVLKACIELNDIKAGKDIHKNLSPSTVNNHFIQTNLIRLYMKSGDYEKSKQIFFSSQNKTTPMFNNLINGLVENNRCSEALDLFRQNNIPTNQFTFSILFKICAQIGDQHPLQFGKEAFDQMPESFQKNTVIITSALHMFIKCGDVDKAEQLFYKLEKNNFIAYSAMMNGKKNKEYHRI